MSRRIAYFRPNSFIKKKDVSHKKLQNHKQEIGYPRTHARTDARTKTIFLVNGFKNPALRAGQKLTPAGTTQ